VLVVIVGPDGSGKSALADALTRDCLSAGLRPERYHFRPYFLGRRRPARVAREPGDRHSTARMPLLPGMAKFLWMIADWWLHRLASFFRVGIAATLAERYALDLLIDPQRYGLQSFSVGVRELVVRLAPKPDLVLVASVDPVVAASRKGELTAQEATAQYGRIASSIRHLDWGQRVTWIPCARPFEPGVALEALRTALVRE
jgi:hypothetical protein